MFLWHVGTKDVLHVLFQTNLKPNDSDVKHGSHVKHSCFLLRSTGVREAQIFDVKHCIDVETQWFLHFQSCLHVQLVLHWTDVDRVGQNFLLMFATLWIQSGSQNNACRTKDVRFQNSFTRPTQQLRILRYP